MNGFKASEDGSLFGLSARSFASVDLDSSEPKPEDGVRLILAKIDPPSVALALGAALGGAPNAGTEAVVGCDAGTDGVRLTPAKIEEVFATVEVSCFSDTTGVKVTGMLELEVTMEALAGVAVVWVADSEVMEGFNCTLPRTGPELGIVCSLDPKVNGFDDVDNGAPTRGLLTNADTEGAPNEKLGLLSEFNARVAPGTVVALSSESFFSIGVRVADLGVVLVGVEDASTALGGDKGFNLGRGAFFHRSLRFWNQARSSFLATASSASTFISY